LRRSIQRRRDELLDRPILREPLRRKSSTDDEPQRHRDTEPAASSPIHCTLPLNAADPRPAGPSHSSVISHEPDMAKSPFASYTPGRSPRVTFVVPVIAIP